MFFKPSPLAASRRRGQFQDLGERLHHLRRLHFQRKMAFLKFHHNRWIGLITGGGMELVFGARGAAVQAVSSAVRSAGSPAVVLLLVFFNA